MIKNQWCAVLSSKEVEKGRLTVKNASVRIWVLTRLEREVSERQIRAYHEGKIWLRSRRKMYL